MSPEKPPFLTNRTYDLLQWVVRVLLPAVATLVASLGLALEWNGSVLVVAILGAVTFFLGSILGISSKRYEPEETPVRGDLNVQTSADGEKMIMQLAIDGPPGSIQNMPKVAFNVVDLNRR